jgi:hypothetical protein
MRVRVSRRRGSESGVIFRRGRRAWWPGIALAASLLCGACGPAAQTDQPDVAWTLSPATALVGPATLTLRINRQSSPVIGATVKLEGHMSHAGMAPVLGTATESAPGVYEVPFTFTMAGDWVLLISGVLADGSRVERRIDVANVRPAG